MWKSAKYERQTHIHKLNSEVLTGHPQGTFMHNDYPLHQNQRGTDSLVRRKQGGGGNNQIRDRNSSRKLKGSRMRKLE